METETRNGTETGEEPRETASNDGGIAAPSSNLRAGWWSLAAVAALAVVVAAALYAWRSGVDPADMAALGYPGIFLVMVVSGSSTLFPAPGHAAVLAAGALWNPLLVGVAAGLGNATGELVGYVVGRTGATALRGHQPPRWWSWLRSWLARYGFVAILALALIPNPTFDVIGLLAGSLAYPARRFWLACAIGNSVKYTGVAYLGDAALWLLG